MFAQTRKEGSVEFSEGSLELTLGKITDWYSLLYCAVILLLIRKALKKYMYETTQNGQIYLFKQNRHHITETMKLISPLKEKKTFSKSFEKPQVLRQKQ